MIVWNFMIKLKLWLDDIFWKKKKCVNFTKRFKITIIYLNERFLLKGTNRNKVRSYFIKFLLFIIELIPQKTNLLNIELILLIIEVLSRITLGTNVYPWVTIYYWQNFGSLFYALAKCFCDFPTTKKLMLHKSNWS